jgi:RNA polymerase sigma-70 factor (ECF subfamily)
MGSPRPSSDHALRERLLRGDRSAGEELFRAHADDLYEFVYWRVGRDAGLAEDVVQDSFLVALDRVADFDGRSSLHTWLCGIAKNKAREARRRHRPRLLSDLLTDSEGEIEAILSRVESEELPDELIEAEATRMLVGATLSSLPPPYKTALLEKYVDGRSVEEMARSSGKGFKATESMLHRARLAFARVFELLAKKSGGLA